MRSVELFAGAGGLAMGVSRAGFHPEAVVEWNHDACDTIRENQRLGVEPVASWPKVFEGDAATFRYDSLKEIDLLAGGPPCQPFSLGGKHRGNNDHRDMFPVAIAAARVLQPKAIIFENVKGLTRPSFANYFEYIKHQIMYPEITRRRSEDWIDHRARLERHHTSKRSDEGLHYRVVARVLNAANYGVPQRRERVFIIGFRSDLNMEWTVPHETHSKGMLLLDQWDTGDYWDRHRVATKDRPARPSNLNARIAQAWGEVEQERVRRSLLPFGHQAPLPLRPWVTVRDVIADLPDPETARASDLKARKIHNHVFQPGARPYTGHTGSPYDEPAKTLKAGDHGVPGGENMLARPDGSVRYFTVRESARLQTFPDDYVFHGVWSENMRQLGNAVPVELAHLLATDIRKRLEAE